MAVFVEVETEPFSDVRRTVVGELAEQNPAAIAPVRRPLRGIEVREPRFSHIRVIDKYGNPVYLVDSGDPNGVGASSVIANYMVTQLTTQRAEKSQIVLTFGENYIFMYGEQPIQATIMGGLVSSNDFTWPAEFWYNYQEVMRGTKLAERGARLFMVIDDLLLEGLVMGASDTRTADVPNFVPFNMNVLVTSIQYLDLVGVDFPIRRQAVQSVPLDQPEAWEAMGLRYTSEQEGFLEKQAGVRSRLLNEASFQRQSAMRALERYASVYEAARDGAMVPVALWQLQTEGAFQRLDAPAGSSQKRPPISRMTPLRSRFSANLDEYLQLPPALPDRPDAEEQGFMDLDEAAEEVGMHGEEVEDRSPAGPNFEESAFDEDVPTPPEGPSEAATTLHEAVGADPSSDVPFGSGTAPGELPAPPESGIPAPGGHGGP